MARTDKNITFDIFFSVSQTQLKFCAGLFRIGDRWVINLNTGNNKNIQIFKKRKKIEKKREKY